MSQWLGDNRDLLGLVRAMPVPARGQGSTGAKACLPKRYCVVCCFSNTGNAAAPKRHSGSNSPAPAVICAQHRQHILKHKDNTQQYFEKDSCFLKDPADGAMLTSHWRSSSVEVIRRHLKAMANVTAQAR